VFLDPENVNLPYVYDNFEWSHCDDENFQFGIRADGSMPSAFALPIHTARGVQPPVDLD
jgi:hypothetical protein